MGKTLPRDVSHLGKGNALEKPVKLFGKWDSEHVIATHCGTDWTVCKQEFEKAQMPNVWLTGVFFESSCISSVFVNALDEFIQSHMHNDEDGLTITQATASQSSRCSLCSLSHIVLTESFLIPKRLWKGKLNTDDHLAPDHENPGTPAPCLSTTGFHTSQFLQAGFTDQLGHLAFILASFIASTSNYTGAPITNTSHMHYPRLTSKEKRKRVHAKLSQEDKNLHREKLVNLTNDLAVTKTLLVENARVMAKKHHRSVSRLQKKCAPNAWNVFVSRELRAYNDEQPKGSRLTSSVYLGSHYPALVQKYSNLNAEEKQDLQKCQVQQHATPKALQHDVDATFDHMEIEWGKALKNVWESKFEAWAVSGPEPANEGSKAKRLVSKEIAECQSIIQEGLYSILQLHKKKKVGMNYSNYELKIVEELYVELQGWLFEKIQNPGELRARSRVQKLLAAVLKDGTCKWVKLSDNAVEKQRAANLLRKEAGEQVYKRRKAKGSTKKSVALSSEFINDDIDM
ncbi:hypothetical protein K439DRAFT_1611525 [Ramaria rubella]|nr:hypothetical protein K439DRAFT_1611525 [Ramaria rubella]